MQYRTFCSTHLGGWGSQGTQYFAQDHKDKAEEPFPEQPEQFDRGGMQNEQYFAAHDNQMEGGIKGESFSSSFSFFQYPVLITLVLLFINHHKEKEERRGRSVLDGARRLVRGAAPTVRGRV